MKLVEKINELKMIDRNNKEYEDHSVVQFFEIAFEEDKNASTFLIS